MKKNCLLIFLICSCARYVYIPPTREIPTVKIAILSGAKEIRISSPDPYLLRSGSKGKYESSLKEWILLDDKLVDREENKLIRDISFPLVVIPKETFFINGREYRGTLSIHKTSNGYLAVNEVNLEDYLKGVVACEIGGLSKNRIEAIKAQAVAARTYAISNLGKHKSRGYDLESSSQDQVYRGVEAERELTNKACEETSGMVLMYKGKIINAMYHSTCGGKTEDIHFRFTNKKVPYLTSVRDNKRKLFRSSKPFCFKSPWYVWRRLWILKTFNEMLTNGISYFFNIHPDSVGAIRTIKINKRSRTGRILDLTIKTESGAYEISGSDMRRLFSLPSTNFEIIKRSNYAKIRGKGYGHGIGMCQWGAIGMAKSGYKYQNILRHYYKGTRVKKIY